jgi:hypothetical protein
MREWFATFGRNITSGLTRNVTTDDIEQQIREMRAMTIAADKWLATIAPGSFSISPSLTVQDVFEAMGLIERDDCIDFNLENTEGMLFPLQPPPQ